MFNVRFTNSKGISLKMGHVSTPFQILSLEGIDGISVDISTSQGAQQVGCSVDHQTLGARRIGLIGKIVNFSPAQLAQIAQIFLPMSTLRLTFEEAYWIDCVISESPVFSYDLKTVTFSVSLLAPSPYWKAVKINSYQLGGLTGGFTFPVNFSQRNPHSFGKRAALLYLNCKNRGNAVTDYMARIRCSSGEAAGVILVNAQTQQFLEISTGLVAGDVLEIYQENGILRATKTSAGMVTDVFADLNEDSDLFYMNVGDNVLRADVIEGEALLEVTIRFYDAVSGVRYGISGLQ